MKNLSLLLGLILTLSFSVLSSANDTGTIGVEPTRPLETSSYVVNRDRRHDSASALLLQVVEDPTNVHETVDKLEPVTELSVPQYDDQNLVNVPEETQHKIK